MLPRLSCLIVHDSCSYAIMNSKVCIPCWLRGGHRHGIRLNGIKKSRCPEIKGPNMQRQRIIDRFAARNTGVEFPESWEGFRYLKEG